MDARPELLPRLEREVKEELERFAGELAGRAHLASSRFERADLTAASLLAPLAKPATCPLHRGVRMPDPVKRVLTRWSVHPALRRVTCIYADHCVASVP